MHTPALDILRAKTASAWPWLAGGVGTAAAAGLGAYGMGVFDQPAPPTLSDYGHAAVNQLQPDASRLLEQGRGAVNQLQPDASRLLEQGRGITRDAIADPSRVLSEGAEAAAGAAKGFSEWWNAPPKR